MIGYRGREVKRGRPSKVSKQLDRLYREAKCRDCSVVVTRMDFAKILGKFTKVKIQYESSTSPNQKTADTPSPNSNARLKNNENGMVLIHRNAYNQHPVKDIVNSKRTKISETVPRQVSNVLKENNGPKNTSLLKERKSNYSDKQRFTNQNNKQYAIIFNDPTSNNNIDVKSDLTLTDLLPNIDKRILPSEDWCIDHFPKNNEPTDDKVYDRIAAELEDLMYNEKPEEKFSKSESTESKVDEFPSIMDILNDNTAPVTNSEPKDQSNTIEFKSNLESSDVEAMLLGKANVNKIDEPSPMEVDNTDVNKLIEDVVQFSSTVEMDKKVVNDLSEVENPHSPSILDEALQKGIEEHLPSHHSPLKEDEVDNCNDINQLAETQLKSENETHDNKPLLGSNTTDNAIIPEELGKDENITQTLNIEEVTHVIFKKIVNGVCQKSVTCPKNLKYSIELEEKSVEFLGAPKYISSLEDLQVLLQIVHETDLQSLYILY